MKCLKGFENKPLDLVPSLRTGKGKAGGEFFLFSPIYSIKRDCAWF